MLRAMVVAALVLIVPRGVGGQDVGVLHIRIALVDAASKRVPVARHALLISNNPSTESPRLVTTGLDGAAEVRLRPGNYTVESDRPVAFGGKAYEWTQTLDIVAGRDAYLELTADNADVSTSAASVASADGTSTTAPEADPSFLLPRWQDSVVALWTPKTHASGFVIDARGLVATNQKDIGSATTVEVQLTPAVKIAARVLSADSARDVAVLWIDPHAVASVRPVPLACDMPDRPIAKGADIYAIGAPLGQPKDMSIGTVSRVDDASLVSGFVLGSGSAGGPVFSADGTLVGLTSVDNGTEERRRSDFRVVRTNALCGAMADAEKQMAKAPAPSAAPLPVEPAVAFPVDALKQAAERRAGSLNPYMVSTSAFDVAFITPVLTFGTQYQAEQAAKRERERAGASAGRDAGGTVVRALQDFGPWSDYVAAFPPVLLVRVTPKFAEGFWGLVARGAAQTQGVALPPLKKLKPGFARMRAYCGDTEVTPIHAFIIEQHLQGNDTINEGLHVYDPGAFGPHCETVKLTIYSEKEPQKADTRIVEPRVVNLVWNDFAPYRNQQQ